MSKGRDATTITDSTGRRRITKLWDGAAAARCGRLRVGPAATPRRPRDGVGSTAFSGALLRSASRRRASRCRRGALPPRRCCFVSGSALPSGRRVPSFLGPATRRWASRRSTRTASADDGRLGLRATPQRTAADSTPSTRHCVCSMVREPPNTHTRRERMRGDRARPAQWTSTAR